MWGPTGRQGRQPNGAAAPRQESAPVGRWNARRENHLFLVTGVTGTKLLRRALRCALLAAACWALSLGTVWGQTPPAYPLEPTRPPVPTQPDRLDPAWDAYQYAEAERRAAIDRQLELNDAMVRRAEAAAQAGIAWSYGPAYPAGSGYYLYGVYDRRASRAYRRELRRGMPPPHRTIEGHIWVGVHPWFELQYAPYVGRVPQPHGHVKIYTGPNGYLYRPLQEPSSYPPPASQPPPLVPDPGQAARAPAPEAEVIPAPLPEPELGPQLLPPPAPPAAP